jgi:hypothetical protein
MCEDGSHGAHAAEGGGGTCPRGAADRAGCRRARRPRGPAAAGLCVRACVRGAVAQWMGGAATLHAGALTGGVAGRTHLRSDTRAAMYVCACRGGGPGGARRKAPGFRSDGLRRARHPGREMSAGGSEREGCSCMGGVRWPPLHGAQRGASPQAKARAPRRRRPPSPSPHGRGRRPTPAPMRSRRT